MLIIMDRHIKNLDKSMSARTFTRLLAAMIIYSVFDMICGLAENNIIVVSRLTSTVANVSFYYASYAVAYLSFFYSECELKSKWVTNRKKVILSLIPVIILLVLTLVSLKLKFFFYIDESGRYIKGELYPFMLLMAYGYIILIGIKAILLVTKKEYYVKREKLIILSSFVIFPLAAGVIQAFNTGISIICFGGTIAMVQVYIRLQETKITIDELTQVNNRTKLIQHLGMKMNYYSKTNERKLYFMMLDMDDFKKINDTYGHVEGDKALVHFANILKIACADYSSFIARYGGDEFSIILEADNESEVKALVKSILDNMKKSNDDNQLYNLSVSIGYEEYSDDIHNIPDFIGKADCNLYCEKAGKKGISHKRMGEKK